MQSSYCNGATACIEVERRGGIIYMRNTGNTSSALLCTPAELLAFFEGVKAGEFDDLVKGSAEGAPLGIIPTALTPVA